MKNTKLTLLSAFLLITSISYGQKQWTLKECVDYALNNNLSINQNKLNLKLSFKDKEIAYGEFLPRVGGSFGNSYSEGLSPDQTGVLKNTKNFRSDVGISVSGNIFNGFRNLNLYKQAELGVESSKLDLEIIQNDITLQVVTTYLNVLFARENLQTAKFQENISRNQIERAQAQFEAGAIPKGDLLNIQSTAANDAQNVVTQENSLDIALLRLSQLLQISSEGFDVGTLNVERPSIVLLYSSSNEVYLNALNSRPEIKKSKLGIRNAELSYEINKGAYYPTLTYGMNVGTSYFNQFNNLPVGFRNDNLFQQLNDRFQYGISVSASIPIFNGFQTKNRVIKSTIDKEQSQLTLESEKLRLQQTIEQAYLDAKASAKTFEAATVSLDAQKEAFKNAQASLDYGAMTQFDYDQVRNRLVNAESALIRAKYDYVFKTKVLKFYYGENILD